MIKYRVDQNAGRLPAYGRIVIQALDRIDRKSIYTLFIRHILEYGPGGAPLRAFMPVVVCNGIVECGPSTIGEDYRRYDMVVEDGFKMLNRMVKELEEYASSYKSHASK